MMVLRLKNINMNILMLPEWEEIEILLFRKLFDDKRYKIMMTLTK